MTDKKELIKTLRENNLNTDAVYLFINDQTGKYYIGSTNNAVIRVNHHLSKLEKGIHENKNFQEAYNENPNFECVVAPMDNRVDAHLFENLVIAEQFEDPNFLNIAPPFDISYIDRYLPNETKDIMSLAMKERWKNSEYRDAMIEGTKNRWKDENYRSKMLSITEELRKDPAFIEHLSNSSKTFWENNPDRKAEFGRESKERWEDPDYREMMNEAIKNFWTDERRAEASKRSKGQWMDEDYRESISQKLKDKWKDPEYRDEMLIKRNDEEYRHKQSENTKRQMEIPEVRENLRESSKLQWENTNIREIKSKKVSIDGVIYNSMIDAANSHGIYPSTVTYRVNSNSEQFRNWTYA